MAREGWLQIRMNDEEKERLKAAADELEMSVSQFVRFIILQYLKKGKK